MNIYIHVEISVRELDSKLLLATLAASKGHQVIDIYQDILQPLNLHCPTCACETEINLYEEVIDKREQYLEKLKEVLGKSD